MKTPLDSDTDMGALPFIPGLVSLIHSSMLNAGDEVTINCLEECNKYKSVTTGNITQIMWKKVNNSHILRFTTRLTPNQTSSNFSKSRFSFQDPLTLRIMDAQPSDSGNYTCELTTSNGFCKKNFPLHVSGKCRIYCIQLKAMIIYQICSTPY